MLSRMHSFLLRGIDALTCEVEVDVDSHDHEGRTLMVGLPDAAVKEAAERVRSAMVNSGYRYPPGRVLVNFAPADVRKEGPLYDLPLAVALLDARGFFEGELAIDPRRCLIAGELALDGRLRSIKGAIAMATLAREQGMEGVILPDVNAAEAAVVAGIHVWGVSTLTEVVGLLKGEIDLEAHAPPDVVAMLEDAPSDIDFREVRGQEAVKRAITIAAAGGHNLLMLGPAGSGKSMMAKALPGVLPRLTVDEALEITRIYSAAGELRRGQGIITSRPVRAPHHTASAAAVVGGGAVPRPGEVSLAHHGVLFLDELPEFPRPVLETLRQPLEDHVVTIARAHASVRFPASVMLVAALNPTAKGDLPPGSEGRADMDRYLSRISGPLLDRIDIHVEAPAVEWDKLRAAPTGTDSATMRDAADRARARQHERQAVPNARLRGRDLDVLARIDESGVSLLGQAINTLGLSARAYDKIRRVARTIADLEGTDLIGTPHIAEAVQYRLLDRRV